MASPTVENYLKAVLHLSQSSSDIAPTDIAQLLEVSLPTVNSMVKKLAELGYVHYEKYKPLTLTEGGKLAAALVVRKHRLAEMFLVEKLGFGWEEVHEVAEQLEHIESALLFQRMDEQLGFPKFDPHGSPIPDAAGNFEWNSYRPLAYYTENSTFVLKALEKSGDEFLRFLNAKNMFLGMRFELISRENFDGSALIRFNENTITLSEKVCERLLVEKV